MAPFDRSYMTYCQCKYRSTLYRCDLEIWIRGHTKSLKMVPVAFESLGMVSYSNFIATMAISLAVSTQQTNVTGHSATSLGCSDVAKMCSEQMLWCKTVTEMETKFNTMWQTLRTDKCGRWRHVNSESPGRRHWSKRRRRRHMKCNVAGRRNKNTRRRWCYHLPCQKHCTHSLEGKVKNIRIF